MLFFSLHFILVTKIFFSNNQPGQKYKKGEFIGCFRNSNRKILPYAAIKPKENGMSVCVDYCSSRGFLFAGLSNGNTCSCGNKNPLKLKRTDVGKCNKACSGNSKEMCGASKTIMIYFSEKLVLSLKIA